MFEIMRVHPLLLFLPLLMCQLTEAEIDGVGHLRKMFGEMFSKLVLRQISSCQLILVTDDFRQSFLSHLIGSLIDKGVPSVIVETKKLYGSNAPDAPSLRNLLQGIWGRPRESCRALIADISGPEVYSVYRFLAASQLNERPDVKVVLLGPKERLQVPLQLETFRNSIHLLYFSIGTFLMQNLRACRGFSIAARNEINNKDHHTWTTVYRRCLYCRSGEAGMELWGSWNLTSIREGNPFREIEENMQGHKLKVVAMNYFPYVEYLRNEDQLGTTVTLTDSLDTKMLATISSALNFTYVVHEPWDRQWGVYSDDTRNWTGIVGTLQYQNADFSLAVGISNGRIQVMDHSRVYIPETFVIVSLEPQPFPQSLALVRPYTGYVWTFVLTCAGIIGVSFWMIQSIWAKIHSSASPSLGFSIFYSWGVLLEDPPRNPPTNATGRMTLGSWLVFCLVTSSAYRSALIAHLTVQKKFPPINTFEDLLSREGWTWGRMPSSGTSFTFFNKSTDPVVNQVFMNIEYHNLDDNMKRVLSGGFSFLTNKYYVSAIINTHYTDSRGFSPIQMGTMDYPIYAGFAWGFRKGAPFRRRFSTAQQRLLEAGLMKPWMDNVIQEQARRERKRKMKEGKVEKITNKETESNVVLSVVHLQGIFFMLFLGHSFASFLLLLETIYYRYRRRN